MHEQHQNCYEDACLCSLFFYKYVLHRHVQVTCSRGNAAMRLLARNWTQLLSLVVLTRFANLGWWTGIAAPDPFTGAACKQCDSYKSTSSKDCGGSMKKSSNCTENSTIGLLMVALIDVPLKLHRFTQVFSFPSESHVTLKVFPCQEVLRCPGKRRKTWTQALLGTSADFTVLHSWQRLFSANNSVIWGSMIRCIWQNILGPATVSKNLIYSFYEGNPINFHCRPLPWMCNRKSQKIRCYRVLAGPKIYPVIFCT